MRNLDFDYFFDQAEDVGFGSLFVQYVETLLWSETDAHGKPLMDVIQIDQLPADTLGQCWEDCYKFFRTFRAYLDTRSELQAKVAHDFVLTRNGHGAGFWDGGWAFNKSYERMAHEMCEQQVQPFHLSKKRRAK